MDKNNRKITTLVLSLLIVNLVAWVGLSYNYPNENKQRQDIDNRLKILETTISGSRKESADIKSQLDSLISTFAKLQNKPPEIVRQEIITQKSSEEILTDAVAKTTPAVVSIVITKDVPKLEVVYINPFGDDPFFQDFGVKVPRYRQKGTEKQKVGAGTGFLVSASGYIVTNRHVIEDDRADYTVLLSDGTQKPATVVYKDPSKDVAVVKVDGDNYQHIDFGNSDSLKLGQSVFAVGNALGEYNNSVSVGIISGLNRDIQASGGGSTEALKGVIQTDAAINPGNSGGPLVALDGKVIGVNVATVVRSNNISFSIPINTIKNIISSVIK